MQAAKTTPDAAATMPEREAEPMKLQKRIGQTVFTVNIRFSQTSTETIEDKILRLIESEVRNAS